MRSDVRSLLKEHKIVVVPGPVLNHRVAFELRHKSPETVFIFLAQQQELYLEDVLNCSTRFKFFLSDYVEGYHVDSMVTCPLDVLQRLYDDQVVINVSKVDTLKRITELSVTETVFDHKTLKADINRELCVVPIDWLRIIQLCSNALCKSIGTKSEKDVVIIIDRVNGHFQKEIATNYGQLPNSNAIERPKIVSKVLDHIKHQQNSKDALIVLDGFAFWQYLLLKQRIERLGLSLNESYTYSWIPTITQLKTIILKIQIMKENCSARIGWTMAYLKMKSAISMVKSPTVAFQAILN